MLQLAKEKEKAAEEKKEADKVAVINLYLRVSSVVSPCHCMLLHTYLSVVVSLQESDNQPVAGTDMYWAVRRSKSNR